MMVLALGTAVALALSMQTRDTALITDRASCASCNITISRLGLYGGGAADSVSPFIGAPLAIAQSAGGGILVMEKQTRNRFVFFYDASGLLTRTIGKAGQGPGELQMPIALVTNATRDSIYVFDARLRQMMVFDLKGRLARSIRLPITAYDVLMLPNKKMVVAANSETRSTAGLTLHLLTPDGSIERSFHPAVLFPREMPSGPMPYLMALNPKGGFVVFDVRLLVFTMYDDRGNVQKVFRRVAAWDNAKRLPVDTITPRGKLEQPYLVSLRPASLLRSIHMDAMGRIWLLALLENPSWQAGGRQWKPYGSAPSYYETFWVGHAEVIDPVTNRLLHAQRLPFIPERFVGDGLVLRSKEDGLGSLQFELFRLGLGPTRASAARPRVNYY